MTKDEIEQLRVSLENHGEAAVRDRLLQKVYGPAKIPIVTAWLQEKEADRAVEAQSQQVAREEAALRATTASSYADAASAAAAIEANKIAASNRNIARLALYVSIFAAAVATLSFIVSVIALNPKK